MGKKPNIIIINPDEMRADMMGHMGNVAAVTPFLDKWMEKEAVSFSNAYCQNPVCVPSRCSFLTGLYPHVHGHRTMSFLLRPHEHTMFEELKNAGYYVWLNGRNDVVSGQYEGLAAREADEIYYSGSEANSKSDPSALNEAMKHRNDKFPYSHYEGRKEVSTDEDWIDVNAAVKRILNPVDDRPLCLFLGLVNPHPPYQAEEPYYSGIDKSKLIPRIRPEECSGKSKMMKLLQQYVAMEEFPEELWEDMRATYLAQCRKIDTMIQMVCDALKEAGEYDNSAIFILSDHGDFTGDYGLPEKAQNTFENCLINVPFLVKPPKGEAVDAGISDSLVELVDFYATVMDYAGVTPDHDHFGKSVRPILLDRSREHRKFVFCEGGRLEHEIQCDEYHVDGPDGPSKENAYWPKKMAQTDSMAHGKATMIFDGRYKYVSRIYDADEFYDLQNDPGERHNVIAASEYKEIILMLKEAMLVWYQETCDVVPRDYDSRFTAEKIWNSVRRICPNECEAELKEALKGETSIMKAYAIAVKLLMHDR